MSHATETVPRIVSAMFSDIQENSPHPRMNPAASNQCHVLTRQLRGALDHRGIQTRREFHKLPLENVWHFVIAHSAIDTPPSDDDLITDLNPWQFMERAPAHYTFLHAPRGEVMERLRQEGAPDYFVALCGLETIVHAHTDMSHPVYR